MARDWTEEHYKDEQPMTDKEKANTPEWPSHFKYQRGDTVRKRGNKGQWHGRIVGWYSTEVTPEGYAVESLYERSSVQIYPASALEAWEQLHVADLRAKIEGMKMKHGPANVPFDNQHNAALDAVLALLPEGV